MLWLLVPLALAAHPAPAHARGPHRSPRAHRATRAALPFTVPEGLQVRPGGHGIYVVRDAKRAYTLRLSTQDRMSVELRLRLPRSSAASASEIISTLSGLNRERRWVTLSLDTSKHQLLLRADQSIASMAELSELLPRAVHFIDSVAQDLPKQWRAVPLLRAHIGSARADAPRSERAVAALSARDRMRKSLASAGVTAEADKDGDLVFALQGFRAFVANDAESPDFLRVATQVPFEGNAVDQHAACNDAQLGLPLCKCVPLDSRSTSLNVEQLLPQTSLGDAQRSAALEALPLCKSAYERALSAPRTRPADARPPRLRRSK